MSLLRTKLWATLSSELRIELFPSHCFCSTSQTPTLSPLTIRESVRPVSDDNILSSLRETSVLGAVSVMQSTRLSAPHSSVPDCLYLPDGSEVSSQNVLFVDRKTKSRYHHRMILIIISLSACLVFRWSSLLYMIRDTVSQRGVLSSLKGSLLEMYQHLFLLILIVV